MSSNNSVSLILPEKVPAALGQLVPISVGVTDFSGTDREILVRLIGSLTGPLPAVSRQLPAHLSIQTEVSLQVPSGMPVGEHPVLIEVLDRSTGSVIGQGEVLLDVQHTQAIRMHLSPPSIRRRLRGRIRIVLRNHDDETHNIRIRAESDDSHTKIKLWHQDVELRAGEMVRLKARLRVKPFFIGKQKEHWYSIIGDGAGVPIYGRGNVRHIPMIGRNIKSLMGLMCIVLVWAGATLAIIRAVNPVTTESTASAEEGGSETGDSGSDSGGELELPNLVEVSGTVTATPDGSGVVVKWRPVSIGDVEGSGKVGGQSTSSNPNVANLSTSTDADGAFTVAGLDGAGLYEFTFAKAGHSTKTLIVQPKGEPVTLEVELAVGDGTVAGLTVDENGQPLGGVDVKLTDGTITYQTTTPTDGDQKGRFTFKNLSTPATYVIDARINQRGLASTTFYLDAGSSTNDVTLTLSPNVSTLAGRVSSMLFEIGSAGTRQTSDAQTPSTASVALPAVTITATDGSTTTRSTTSLTDINLAGTFRLEELPINRVYTVTYSVPGFITYSETVELTVDTPERDISLNRATGRVSGTIVVDSPDILPQSVAISVENSLQTYKSSDLVRADGTYDFSGIAPGRYVVTYEALGLNDQYREVDIGAGTSAIVDVQMTEVADSSRSSSLSFIVTKTGEDINSPDPEDVFVSVRHRSLNDCGRVGTLTSCEYPTTIIPTTATTSVLIDDLDAGAYYLVFSAIGFSPKVVQTSVELGEDKEQIAVTLDALGTLSGQVTDDSGSPVEGVQLLLTSATGVTKTGGTGPNGEFTFPNSLDAMTYTLGTTSPNFTSVSRTVTGALNASVNVDATVRGISMVTGEVRSLNLVTGNYEAIEAKNFAVFYRVSPAQPSTTTGGWIDTKTIGISKSLGSFRLGVNPKDQNNNTVLFDACVAIIDGTIAGTVMSSDACDASLQGTAMPAGLIAKSSTSVSLQPGETAVRSVYFTPSPGSVSGYVTVGGVAENNLKIEARRIGPDGRIYETVNATSATNSVNQQSGYYIFDYLTPTSPVAPTGYDENTFVPCDQTVNICWSIRATKTSVGSNDSRPFTIYPSKRLNLPDPNETINIELGRGSASVTLSADTGVVFSGTTLNLTATINGVAKTASAVTNANGKAVFSNLELGTWTLSLPATDDYADVNREFNITQGVALNESVVRRSLRGKLIIYLRGPVGPLSGAQIRLAPDSDSTTTTTTPTSTTTTIAGTPDPTVLCISIADGSCTINNYNTGVHTFVASATGLSSTTISASVIGGQTIAVSVVLGAAAGSLTVTLLDVLGEKLAGATINAKDQRLNDYYCTTDTTGICTLTEIPFGIVEVKASLTNFRDSFGSISVGSGGSAMTLIATPTNGKATFVFVDDNGQGLLSAKAEYINSAGEVLQTCTTPTTPPTSNQCIMIGLPQGLVTIRASVTGVNASQYAEVTLKVSVFPGLDTAATFVIPTKNAALAGKIVEDVTGGSSLVTVSGAIVTATNGAGESAVTLTDDGGNYSFSTLTPGTWTIRATAPGYATKTLGASLPNQNLEIRLVPLSGSIELSVRTPIGGPATGITVTVQRMTANADVYSLVTNSDGNAIFDQSTIVEGTYTVTISDSIVPARYVGQTFVLNVDRGSATRFATYLGTFGAFVAVPIAGIPASGFGPATPLSVDVALIKDGVLMHQISTEMIASQRVASFAGVAPGQYSVAIQSPGTLSGLNQYSITEVRRSNQGGVLFITSADHGLVVGDSVDISGFAKTIFNFDNAIVTGVEDARSFFVQRETEPIALPTAGEYASAKMTKVSNQSQWVLAAHTVSTNSFTYDVPTAPTIEVPELSRTITLGAINLIVKPVDFDVVVSGIAFTDPSLTTTTTPSSTTLPLLGNAKVTLSDGYLLNSVSSTTNSSGVASFSDIPPGTYTATVTNTSYDDFVTTIQVVDFANLAGFNPRISLNQSPIVGTIKVTVFGDGNSSNYVSGATVSVLENNTTCVTDSSGMCVLKNLAQGDYNLRVIHPSYATINTSTIHVTGGLETTHSVGLGSDEGQVDFTVFNSATGLPIQSATITAQVSGTAPSCTTNAAGKCSVTDLALGATSFKVEANNFDIGFVGIDVTGGNPTKITINLTPSLPTTETLRVRTVDAVTGQPLNGVLVSNADDDAVLCTTAGQTSATPPVALGACNGLSIPVGNLSVKGELDDYETAFATVVISPIQSTTLVLALRPKLGSLQFDIYHAITKANLVGATVTMVEPPSLDCTTVLIVATSTASCTIGGISLVNTTFVVEATGFDDVYVSYAVSNEGGRVRVELTPSDNTLIINTVDAVTGAALAGVDIDHGSTQLCTTAGAGATCTTPPQTNGSYPLTITRAGYETLYATVLVRPDAPTSLTFALRPTFGTVQFIVKDAATGALVPSAVIESVNDNTDTCTTPTGAGTTGRCSIDNLALVATQFEVTAPSYNGGSTNVSVSNVAGSETVVLLNKETVGFTVYTFDAVTDTALNGITVEYANGDPFCTAVTASGSCQPAANLPGGTITLKAYKDNAYLPIFATTTFSTSEPTSLSLALLPTNGAVEISVVNGNDDSEINGVVITRSPSESVCTTASSTGCTVASMPVGTYVFTATKAGYTTATTTATVVNSDTSYIALTMYPVTNNSLRVYTYDASTGSSLDGVSVTSCTGNTSSGYCTANNVATGQLTITASRSGYDNAYGNVMIESGGSETVHLYLRPTASTLTVTVLNSFNNTAISGASVGITSGSCGNSNGSGVSTCTGFISGNLSLSVSAGNFNSATATIAIGRGSTNSVVLFLTPLGQLTVSTTMKPTLIQVSLQSLSTPNCSIRALSGTEAPTTGECTLYSLPYGTYIVVLDTTPAKTATVTINKPSTSVNIP